jgi:hypothetical protein
MTHLGLPPHDAVTPGQLAPAAPDLPVVVRRHLASLVGPPLCVRSPRSQWVRLGLFLGHPHDIRDVHVFIEDLVEEGPKLGREGKILLSSTLPVLVLWRDRQRPEPLRGAEPQEKHAHRAPGVANGERTSDRGQPIDGFRDAIRSPTQYGVDIDSESGWPFGTLQPRTDLVPTQVRSHTQGWRRLETREAAQRLTAHH